jgi:hypothetical protein
MVRAIVAADVSGSNPARRRMADGGQKYASPCVHLSG